MAFFKAKVGDKTYSLERLTLGDARTLKRDFGLSDLSEFSPSDPDQIVGLLALAIHKDDPSLTIEQATAEAESIDIEQFEAMDGDEDPTPAAETATDGEDEAAPAASGSRATTRKKTGSRS